MSRIAEKFSADAYGDQSYPASPGYKEKTTSRDAAIAIKGKAAVLRERAYAAIRNAGPKGLTPDQTAAAIGESVLAVRPRITELSQERPPRIVLTGERRTNDTGLKAKVWRAV